MILKGFRTAGMLAFMTAAVCFSAEGADDSAALSSLPGQSQIIAGPLPRTVRAGIYFVNADIEVPRNKIVTIEEGAVFLFKNFTSLHVQGTLVAKGSRGKPIVFTSEFDKDYNPKSSQEANPFDWNGIYLHADALSTRFMFCKILYSVYGLISETKFIRIDPSIFLYNGKSNLIVENQEQFESGGAGQYQYVLTQKDATVDGVPVKLLDDPLASKRNLFRWGGAAVFFAGTAGSVYQAWGIHANYNRLRELSSTTEANLNENNTGVWKTTEKYLKRDIVFSIPVTLAGILGLAGFSWSFSF